MKNFTSVNDVDNLNDWLELADVFQKNPLHFSEVGKGKMLGLLFLNPSLRTRMSTQKAAYQLGMNVMVMNLDKDGWQLELEDGAIMNGNAQEHVKEAARVMSQYCDVIGVRSFPGLEDREADYSEPVLEAFKKYATVPILSLESATRHPLQSFADMITIRNTTAKPRPKVVLTWAPHPRKLPQAVSNSFLEWMKLADVDLVVTHPEGFDLAPEFAADVTVTNDQESALAGADFVYAKNWSAYEPYGKTAPELTDWQITTEKMALTDNGRFMHCLPVRRNVVVADEVLDGSQSLVVQQASNRVISAQVALYKLLENG